MKKFEEIREILTSKISLEKKRLKSFGTQPNSFDLANALTRHVQALMCESRNSELKRIHKKIYKETDTKDERPTYPDGKKIGRYVEERMKATKAMKTALENAAKDADKKRPWRKK